jgi:hypothetical protein
MHFDQRTQQALRAFGLSTEELREISAAVVEATAEEAAALEAFFADIEPVYSDMELAHSSGDHTEHGAVSVDLYTHADDLRGYVSFDGWGAYVEDGRVLSETVVELTLGPTVHDRVRFAAAPEEL